MSEAKCVHHYLLPESPTRGVYVGRCKKCGVIKIFHVTIVASYSDYQSPTSKELANFIQ